MPVLYNSQVEKQAWVLGLREKQGRIWYKESALIAITHM